MADRVLVIGLDGATWTALDPLMDEGRMPALAALTERGFRAALESTVPPVTAPAWSSFITGCNPGQHGIYQFYEIDPWSERALGRGAETFLAEPGIVVNGKALGGPKLWEIASDAGLRCATINLPMTYPPSPINGLMVTDMLTPPGSRRFTTPPELADELVDYEIDLTPAEKDFTLGDDAFLARAESVLDKRGRAVVRLFERESWDLFVAIFTETDRLQHRYWNVLRPDARTADTAALRERVVALYEKLDGYIAALVERAGDDVRIVVVSDHGFGAAASRRVSLERLAVELGLGSGVSSPRRLAKLGITKRRVYKYLGWLVPDGRLRNAERMARDRALRDVKGKLVKLHDYIGGVWIHAAARGGPVPDADVPALREQIIDTLLGLRDPKTGARFVERAVPREALFSGERVSAAPDVIFFVDDRYGLDPSPRQSGIVYTFTPPQTGTHRSDGIVSLAGPGLVAAEPSAPPRIEDVAPTVLHLLGLAVPAAMDGRVLEECFSDELRRSRPVAVSHDSYASTSGVGAWDSESEQDEIMERLRGIGYVE
ncbi:MAG TPA: alkaline phosphatase family protein [Blastocatellia bacterium]|nr:alkaline phosphatase family protein [Blastocatellia bacterium]